MRFCRIFLALILSITLFSASAYGFEVTHIQITGLHHVSSDKARAMLPIHVGEAYTEASGDRIIRTLYKSGLFQNIQLSRRAGTLMVHVEERPIISVLTIEGNDEVKLKDLRSVLTKAFDLQEGALFDPEKFKQVPILLKQLYGYHGYHATQVHTSEEQSPKHPGVALTITIKEGPVTKAGSIQFSGNHAFTSRQLRKQLGLKTPGIFTWFTHKDRYSDQILTTDLQNLWEFYRNHGYWDFKILSRNVQLSPDKRRAYIVIHISEGAVYHYAGYKITGHLHGFEPRMQKAIPWKAGDIFSNEAVKNTQTMILNTLGNRGYAHATVKIQPKIDSKKHTIYITFSVVSGPVVYVRRITFSGNTRTNQKVLRERILQYEGSIYSKAKIERSKQILNFVSAFATADPRNEPTDTVTPVPGHPDEVDVDYHVKEQQTGRARVAGGYSSTDGFFYGIDLSDSNILGSGKSFGLGFSNNQLYNQYYVNYADPYYKEWGLSRSIGAYYTKQKVGSRVNIAIPYSLDGYGLNVNYGYLISPRNSFSFGYGYERINVNNVNTGTAAPDILQFLNIPLCPNRGNANCPIGPTRVFNQFKLYAGWQYQGLDRMVLPTRGLQVNGNLEVGLPIIKSSNGYYLLTANLQYYLPIWHDFIFNLSANLGYGDGFVKSTPHLPFYKNFYAGGIGSVPAYSPNSLGPKNVLNNNDAIGGNLKTVFGAHLILPPFISEKVRMAVLFDAGNIFQAPRYSVDLQSPTSIIQNDKFSLSNLRYSIGVGVEWITPFAPISATIAFPIDKKAGDDTQVFQFSMSLGF